MNNRRSLPIVLLITSISLFAQGQTGAIAGRVIGMDGKPAAGVRVAIVSPDANGKIESDIMAGLTTTDETGHFRIENVPPGRYGIAAGAVSAPTYYPGTASVSGASLLTVERGSTTTGLDFVLTTATVPLPGTQNAVDPSLRAQTIAQLNQQLALPSQVISGRVVVDGPIVSAFLPNLKIRLLGFVGPMVSFVLPGGATGLSANAMSITSTDVKPDGSFRLELKPIMYRILVERSDGKPLEGFVVKSIRIGTTDITNKELNVNGTVSGEIVITLQPVPLTVPLKL